MTGLSNLVWGSSLDLGTECLGYNCVSCGICPDRTNAAPQRGSVAATKKQWTGMVMIFARCEKCGLGYFELVPRENVHVAMTLWSSAHLVRSPGCPLLKGQIVSGE